SSGGGARRGTEQRVERRRRGDPRWPLKRLCDVFLNCFHRVENSCRRGSRQVTETTNGRRAPPAVGKRPPAAARGAPRAPVRFPAYFGSTTRPRKRRLPERLSRIRNRNGWSARNAGGALSRSTTTAVAPVASVPTSSTLTNALCTVSR